MSYSYVRYVVDAGIISVPTLSYSSFDLLPDGAAPIINQFDVYLNNELLTYAIDYTVNTGSSTITLIRALTLGQSIVIQRDTRKDELYVNFQTNALLDEGDLDLDFSQIFFVAQEAFDLATDTIHFTADRTAWDGRAIPSTNSAPATTGSGWVTLNQALDILGGAQTAILDGCQEWCFAANGTDTVYPMAGTPCPSDDCLFFVTIDGVTIASTCAGFPGGISAAGQGSSPPTTPAQGDTIEDDLPGGVCVTITEPVSATMIAAVTAKIALFDAAYLVVTCDYGTSSTGENTGTLQDALAYYSPGGAGSGLGGVLKYCPHDVRTRRLTYSVDCAADTITFNYPPPAGQNVQIRLLTGTVSATFAEGTIDGDSLTDRSVDLIKLNIGATDPAWRFVGAGPFGDYVGMNAIIPSMVYGFDTGVRLNRLDQMAAPTAAVSMNNQQIHLLTAGTVSGDAVNYAQLTNLTSTITNNLNDFITIAYNKYTEAYASGGLGGSAADMYFQTRDNLRATYAAPPQVNATYWRGVPAREARIVGTGADPLLQYFVPRRLTILVSGALYECNPTTGATTGVQLGTLSKVIRFERWDQDLTVGFDPHASLISGSISRYRVTGYNYEKDGTEQYDNTSWPSSSEVFLDIEFVYPFRTWLRIFKNGLTNKPCAVTKVSTPGTPGVIQVIAEKGL